MKTPLFGELIEKGTMRQYNEKLKTQGNTDKYDGFCAYWLNENIVGLVP